MQILREVSSHTKHKNALQAGWLRRIGCRNSRRMPPSRSKLKKAPEEEPWAPPEIRGIY